MESRTLSNMAVRNLLRHLFAIVVLPVTMTIVIPVWVAARYDVALTGPRTLADGALLVLGVATLGAGLALFIACLRLFANQGRGTLAPWAPPQVLVVTGPYRYARHPMISGVILILVGEALILRSAPHALWAMTFMAMNLTYIPLFEEPQLRVRFGEQYDEYRRHVPGLVPRLRPWTRARP